MTVERHLQLVGLRPEQRDNYLTLHSAVWPAITERLSMSGISNYTIFLRDELLIAYFEYTGVDWTADSAKIAADPATREWWQLTTPCQIPLPSAAPGEVWVDASEIWHLQ